MKYIISKFSSSGELGALQELKNFSLLEIKPSSPKPRMLFIHVIQVTYANKHYSPQNNLYHLQTI